MLETRKIAYEQVDIAAPENEDEKQFMRDNAVPEEGKNFVLPPQIFNNVTYCGVSVMVLRVNALKLYSSERSAKVASLF